MPRISIGGTRELSITTDISGQAVWVGSGEVTILSGDVRAQQLGAWGVQVSGAVQVSGEVISKVSGERIRIEGYYPASGDWRPLAVDASGEIRVEAVAEVSGKIVRAEQYGTWGVQVSGEVGATQVGAWDVSVSGSVTVISGQVDILNMPPVTTDISGQAVWVGSGEITILSGDVRAQQLGAWGVQVSGAVQVSGEVTAYISGQPVDITIPTDIVINAGANPLAVASLSGGTILTSADCISVTVKALSENSGDIYVGGYTAGNMPYSGAGLLLAPGEAVNIDIDNTGKVHVFAAISGDKVTYIANR